MKFPKRLRYKNRGKTLATIYKGDHPTQPYCLYWRIRVEGKPRSRFKSFFTYSEAKRAGEKIVADIARGALAATLSPGQVTDALAALERLRAYYVATGRNVSLLGAVSEFAEASSMVKDVTLVEAVTGFNRTVASVKPKLLADAVEEFVAAEQPKTLSHDGQRPELGSGYANQKAQILRRFAGMFQNYMVRDLSKTNLGKFISELPKLKERPALSPKSRNNHRTVVKQFLNWAARSDYLPSNHRLFEADSMRPEKTNGGETEFYMPKEFRALLEAADGTMPALIAIGGLGGLRSAELLRLDWSDVWRVLGHIEVTASKSKTRQRRLVEMCPALTAWLAPFRQNKDGRLWNTTESKFQKRIDAIAETAGIARKRNGLRHSYCTFHFALHANENLTAQQAGNSPGVIHGHYKGLATRKEAKAWFAVKPVKSEANIIQLQTKAV